MKNLKNNDNIGYIASFFSGVARIKDLQNVFIHEVLLNSNKDEVAIVIGFDEEFVDALFFDDTFDLSEPLFRSHKPFSIVDSDKYIGRIVNGFAKQMDDLDEIKGNSISVFQNAPTIIERSPVTTPIITGIKVIDTNIPIGNGQRELIIGDRKLGKSTIAIDTVLNQKNSKKKMNCIYVVCGQKNIQVEKLIDIFRKNNSFLYTTIVFAPAQSSFAEKYLAPFVGCTIGEILRNKGEDVLIIYDDLTKHAKAYRDIALLLERTPGREAYPGDIFSLHAGLLERAAQLSAEKGGGSLTALPIVETQQGDITSFVSTNLISITDGQIYLEDSLFQNSHFPAVNIGLSVSRIGSQVQPKALRDVVKGIRLAIAQHKELQSLVKLETNVSKESLIKLKRGDLLIELLKQKKHTIVKCYEQVVLFFMILNGYFDEVDPEKWMNIEYLLLKWIDFQDPVVIKEIKEGTVDMKDDMLKQKILNITESFKKEFL